MNKLQEKLLDILKVYLEICDKLGLTYYLANGSALGAEKYGGFIPWDDDMDVVMPREDYEIFCEKEFIELGAKVFVTTVDGSYGTKGFVTNAMENKDYDYFYTCGPMPMFKAIENTAKTSGQYSFEERMGCGFGACMGCSCKTKYGNKRICKDGPVLEREEIIW